MKNIIILSIVSLLLTACSTTKVDTDHILYSDSFKTFDKTKKIVLIPLVNEEISKGSGNKLTFDINEKFETGSKITFDIIGKQLKDSGWNVVVLNKENYLSVQAGIDETLGGIFSPVTGEVDPKKKAFSLMSLVKAINSNSEYSAVLIPEFSLRIAKLSGRSATWDGSNRRVISNGKIVNSINYSGATRGLSLGITAFDGEGNWAFTSYGGLALPFDNKMSRKDASMAIREDLFDNVEDIESGVKVALSPLTGE